MKFRVFIDTNVFIYAYEYPKSNSASVIELLNHGKIEAVISERVFNEVLKYFETYHSLELMRHFRRYLLESTSVVARELLLEKMSELKGQIKDKDLEQLAVVKYLGIKYLLAYDRDFENFEEYNTPKKFVKILELKPYAEEY